MKRDLIEFLSKEFPEYTFSRGPHSHEYEGKIYEYEALYINGIYCGSYKEQEKDLNCFYPIGVDVQIVKNIKDTINFLKERGKL